MADTQAKIVVSAEDRTSRVFSGLRSNLGGLSAQAGSVSKSFVALAPALVAAFSVDKLVSFFGRVVDGIDELNDLADATGSTVEKLSGLEDIGARTGTSVDTIGQALTRLTKNLIEARDPSSEAAQLFKALGLNAEELSRADPSDALLRVSKALDGFANNAQKGQFQLLLLGKSTRQLAPFLKDLAEAGELNGNVTQEQADAADLFNKQLFQLQKNATDAARVIAGPIVESINSLIGRYQEARKEGQGLFEFLARGYASLARDNLKLLGLGGLAGPEPNRQKASGVVTTEAPATPKPTIALPDAGKPGRIAGGGGSSARDRISDAQEYLQTLQRQLQGTQDLSVAETVLADIQAGRLKLAKGESAQPLLDIAAQIDQAKRRQDQLKAEAEQVRQLRTEQERLARSGAQVFEQTRTPAERFGAELADIQELLQRGAIDSETYYRRVAQLREEFDKLGEAKETVSELDTFTQRAAQNIQDALGTELANVLDGNFKNIGDTFTKLLNRMVAEAAAAQISRALFGDLNKPEGGDGGLLGNLFKSGAKALASFGSSFFSPSGGAASGSNMLERDMITLVHKGEAIVPKAYNPAAGGAGGRALNVTINQTFAAGTSRQTSMQAAADAQRALSSAARNL